MKRYIKVIAAASVLMLLFAGCGKDEVQEPEAVLTAVEVGTMTTGTLAEDYSVTGQTKALTEVDISSKVQGKAQSVTKKLGDTVASGETLVSLDYSDITQQIKVLDDQIAQAQTAVNSAQASGNMQTGSGYDQQLSQLESAVNQASYALEQAQLNLSTSQTDYDNNLKLYQVGGISKTALDASKDKLDLAQTTYDNAKSSYDSAKKNYDLAAGDAYDDTKIVANSQLESALASKNALITQKSNLQEKIADYSIKSPIAGVIIDKKIEQGEMVSPSSPLFVIADVSNIVVESYVSENYVNKMNVGTQVSVIVPAVGDEPFTGTVSVINPSATQQKSGYLVQIKIDNKEQKIKPGMYAKVGFSVDARAGLKLLDISTVITDNDENYVYVLNGDNTVSRRDVEVGMKGKDQIEIISGLSDGEKVVTKGQKFLTDGEQVNVVAGV